MRPLIGITPDITEQKPGSPRAQVALAYADSIRAAGGVPCILAPSVDLVSEHLQLCHGFVLTGGDDPCTEPFGEPTHAAANRVHPLRQEFESALLMAIHDQPPVPTLGICLGMQMMALTSGGRLNQHLPDTHATAPQHAGNVRHEVRPAGDSPITPGVVTSSHHQAVADPGRLRVLATAHDGVIEAIGDPSHPCFLGVQWHPERTDDESLGRGMFRRLVLAAASRKDLG